MSSRSRKLATSDHADCEMVVIFSTMRSGTNLLEHILTQHPKLVGFGELFNPNFIGRKNNTSLLGMDIFTRDAQPFEFLSKIRESLPAHKRPIFRIFPEHAPSVANALIEMPEVKKIILKRDPIARYASWKTAHETREWIAHRRKESPQAKFTFDLDEFRLHKSQAERFFAELEERLLANKQDYYLLDFADVLKLETIEEICEFIGIEPIGYFFETTKKQNPVALQDRVSNPEILHELSQPFVKSDQPADAKPHQPAIEKIYIAENLNLAYVPIPGNAVAQEISALEQAAGAPLLEISSAAFNAQLETNKSLHSYTRVIHPADRLHILFSREVFGLSQELDCPLSAFIELVDLPEQLPFPLPTSKTGLAELGITQSVYRELERRFATAVFRELWIGQRNHVIGHAFWPQQLLLENLRPYVSPQIIIGDNFPADSIFDALRPFAPVTDPLLRNPYSANRITHGNLDRSVNKLFREDLAYFDF